MDFPRNDKCTSQGTANGLPGERQMHFHKEGCNVLELVDNFGFLISFFFDKFIC